jgi:hypothetical protein
MPIVTKHLFPILDQKLLEILRSLSYQDWKRPSRAKLWSVKDIASHLLDGNIRTLSMSRDGHFEQAPVMHTYQDLVSYLNKLNADWITASKRISPETLIALLETTGKEYCDYIQTLDPIADAIFSVAWAGEKVSKNWFHIAREYTEKWHHQQQIREAINPHINIGEGLMTAELYQPLIETFMQALPHTYRNIVAPEDATIKVTVTSFIGGEWLLVRKDNAWKFSKESTSKPVAEITLDPNTAWQLFTKGLSPAEAEKSVQISGDYQLGKPILGMLSIMA